MAGGRCAVTGREVPRVCLGVTWDTGMTTLEWLVGVGLNLQLVAGARCCRTGISAGLTLERLIL